MSDDLEKRVNFLEFTVTRLERVEEKRGQEIDRLISTVERLVDRVDTMVSRTKDVEVELAQMRKDVWNSKLVTKTAVWLAGVIVTGSVLTVIAFLFGVNNG